MLLVLKVKKKDEKYYRPPYAVTGLGLGALYDERKELIVTIDGGEIKEVKSSDLVKGTKIIVKDLLGFAEKVSNKW